MAQVKSNSFVLLSPNIKQLHLDQTADRTARKSLWTFCSPYMQVGTETTNNYLRPFIIIMSCFRFTPRMGENIDTRWRTLLHWV